MDALVTTAWLADEGAGARILDASYFLAEHRRDAAAEYRAGHIPGAGFLDLASLANPDTALPSMLPSPQRLAARLGSLGVGDGDRVILYDDSPLHSAARAWWMLRAMGLAEVAILDGGLAAWRAEGRPLASGAETIAPVSLTLSPARGVRTLADMRANLDEQREQVVDARSPARFAGEEPEPRPGTVPGHIPGSRNLHYARLFDADGLWKRGDALRAAFVEAGIDLDGPVVTTCGSGITAAVLAFGLHLLGQDAALYDGSWAEWGADPSTPKESGRA